jgi:hypothetical protein
MTGTQACPELPDTSSGLSAKDEAEKGQSDTLNETLLNGETRAGGVWTP